MDAGLGVVLVHWFGVFVDRLVFESVSSSLVTRWFRVPAARTPIRAELFWGLSTIRSMRSWGRGTRARPS